MKRYHLLILCVFVLNGVFAQADSLKLVKYSSGFRFREGLYLTHDQMVKNSPIRKSQIISKYNKKDFDFFTKLLSEERILFFDKYGLRKEIEVVDLWGFCRRGSIFINWGDDFNRIPVMGTLCHFVASVTVVNEQMDMPVSSFSYYDMPSRTSRTEINQYLMDFETGQVLDYNMANIEMFLSRSPELYEEFMALKKKKKKQMKFLYVRKLNERYPIYILID